MQTNNNIILKVSSLSKSFDNGKTFTPHNVNFELTDNDRLLFIIGKNGQGKTVLLKLLTREESNHTGEITYCKDLFNDLTIQYQNEGLIPNLTILDNLKIVCKDENNIKLALKELNVPEEILIKRGFNLSGGEQRQIQLTRSMLSGRKIWICDEPTASLDKNMTLLFIEYIAKSIQDKQFIIISHDDFFIRELKQKISNYKEIYL